MAYNKTQIIRMMREPAPCFIKLRRLSLALGLRFEGELLASSKDWSAAMKIMGIRWTEALYEAEMQKYNEFKRTVMMFLLAEYKWQSGELA